MDDRLSGAIRHGLKGFQDVLKSGPMVRRWVVSNGRKERFEGRSGLISQGRMVGIVEFRGVHGGSLSAARGGEPLAGRFGSVVLGDRFATDRPEIGSVLIFSSFKEPDLAPGGPAQPLLLRSVK